MRQRASRELRVEAVCVGLEGEGVTARGGWVSDSWVQADDPAGMDRLDAYIGRLRPSGGGDAPEDAAGGLAAVGRLFEALGEPSLRLCVLMADAPCHGMTACGELDHHKRHGGRDQAERAREVVQEVFVRGGAELVLCNPGSRASTSRMVEEFNALLGPVHSHVDEASALARPACPRAVCRVQRCRGPNVVRSRRGRAHWGEDLHTAVPRRAGCSGAGGLAVDD